MTKFLLAVHVLAAIIAIGPVTVAASMFPAAVRQGSAGVHTLYRICRIYAGVGIAVPVFGLVTAQSMHVLGQIWLIVSMVLTAVAAGVLMLLVLPGQEVLVAALDDGGEVERRATARLAMYAGMFNLLWATVTVLMIIRPGSTTGA
jgi:hypothetical protein